MSLASLLGEGLESALLTCSLMLLVPGAAVGLSARRAAVPAMVGFSVGVLLLSWLRFSDRGGGFSNLLIAAALAFATVALFAPPGRRINPARRYALSALPAGLMAGGAAAELWRPCVGEHFGLLLNDLPNRGVSGIGLLAIFLAGTLSPLVVVGAVRHLVPDSMRARAGLVASLFGGSLLTLLALATALGYHEALVSQLFLWSANNV